MCMWPITSANHVYVTNKMWFDRVPVCALAGPLKDIQRLVPKPLLRCLGCVIRVVVLLEGEPSPKSEFLSALEQVFIKDLCPLLHLSFPRSWLVSQFLLLKTSPQHDPSILQTFFGTLPQICALKTILSQSATDNSFNLMDGFLLWHALSTVGPYTVEVGSLHTP